MIHRVHSTKPIDAIGEGLAAAAARHSFGVIAVHDLKATLEKKGVGLGMECRVFEVCNPVQARRVLETDGAVSTALPCRISVYGQPGDYTLATLLPGEMMKAFGRPELEPVAAEVETVLKAMMEEAAVS